MATDRQIAANRRNARHSTGPRTDSGKARTRQNAISHGLTASTVVASFEDRREYEALAKEIQADYRPWTTIEHHLVARLTSLLWRLRRATKIELGLFEIQARILRRQRRRSVSDLSVFYRLLDNPKTPPIADRLPATNAAGRPNPTELPHHRRTDPASVFARLCRSDSNAFERLVRYESYLWRQTTQTLLLLEVCKANGDDSSDLTLCRTDPDLAAPK
jgi:hypothetical protein